MSDFDPYLLLRKKRFGSRCQNLALLANLQVKVEKSDVKPTKCIPGSNGQLNNIQVSDSILVICVINTIIQLFHLTKK